MNWYPITPIHPPPLAQVRGIVTLPPTGVHSYEAELIISRGRPPNASIWASWVRGTPKPLPVGGTPCFWQPQWPEKWTQPLPEPVPAVSERMYASKVGFTLVADALGEAPAQRMPHQWWRDADLIRYEPAGCISQRMAEGRIMRAVAMCGHNRTFAPALKTFAQSLSRMAAPTPDSEPYALADYMPPLRPLRQDETDFSIAMDWFVKLNLSPQSGAYAFNRVQQLLLHKASDIPLSYDVIGSIWGVHRSAVAQAWARAIDKVTQIANSGKV